MKKEKLEIFVDSDLKKEAEKVLNRYDLSLDEAVEGLFEEIGRTGSLPIKLPHPHTYHPSSFNADCYGDAAVELEKACNGFL